MKAAATKRGGARKSATKTPAVKKASGGVPAAKKAATKRRATPAPAVLPRTAVKSTKRAGARTRK
jgi:hypothetical protein